MNETNRKTVGEWLLKPFIWRIPVYQRHYAWDANQESGPIHLFWETVEEQTTARLEGKTPPNHYLGAVLVSNQTPLTNTEGVIYYDVIDGQQRLTTIQLALLALISVAKCYGYNKELEEKLKEYVFCNFTKNKPRLFPTNFDLEQFNLVLFQTYNILLDLRQPNVGEVNKKKSRIYSTYNFFEEAYKEFIKNNHKHNEQNIIEKIVETLTKGFDFVLIVLLKTDEAQRIFESLNNYAKPLTTLDLIRNNVFRRASLEERGKDEKLFNSLNWQKFEQPYWEEKADKQRHILNPHIEAYIARTLVAKMKKEIHFNRNNIFKSYKEFFPEKGEEPLPTEKIIESLGSYTDIYQYLDGVKIRRNPITPETDFGIFRYNIWNNRDYYPVIFSIVDSDVDGNQKRRMIMLLESYVIRRNVCGLSGESYNKHAVNICKSLEGSFNYDDFRKILISNDSVSSVFPDDEMVMNECVTSNFYKSKLKKYVFEKIEKSMNEIKVEKIIVEQGFLTIDHILPKKWEQNPKWEEMILGSDSTGTEKFAVPIYINTIGNLALMSGKNNSIKSNRPLDEVKKLLSESTLKLNRDLAEKKEWNVEKIVERSKILAQKICQVWPQDIPQ